MASPPETLLGVLPREIRAMLIPVVPVSHLLVESKLRDLKALVSQEQIDMSRRCLCHYTAQMCNLPLLKWARKHGCGWDLWVGLYAGLGGDVEYLKWIRDKGCPLDEWVCRCAASEGHLRALQWAVQAGCPFRPEDCLKHATEANGTKAWIRSQLLPDYYR